MSFKSELKNFGLGSRGPYGRMESGGQRLSETLGSWADEKRESGWNQALVAAAKEGKSIKPMDMVQISNMWKVPLPQVMSAAEKINEPIRDQQIKDGGKSFYIALENIIKEGKTPDEKQFQKLVKDSFSEDLDVREVGVIAMQIFQQVVPQIKESLITVKKDEKVYKNLNGEINPIPVIDNTVPEKPKYISKTIYGPDGKTKQVAIKDGVEYAPPEGWSLTAPSASDATGENIASDIRSASQQLKSIQAGVNMSKDILWTPQHIEAVRSAKRELDVMVKAYEEIHGPGSAKRAGFDTTLSKPQAITPEMTRAYIELANGDRAKAREMAIADGYKIP